MGEVVVLSAARVPAPENMSARFLVDVGAGLLDVERPGWWNHVDLETLDQAYPHRCVLAQMMHSGNWLAGLDALFPRLQMAGQLLAAQRAGFWVNDHAPGAAESDSCLARYEELTKWWRAAIVARRENVEVSESGHGS
jgi:hypothetical protein